ncbi:MAG: hypothetical protein V3V75_01405 [Thermoguttaceae bacterium]
MLEKTAIGGISRGRPSPGTSSKTLARLHGTHHADESFLEVLRFDHPLNEDFFSMRSVQVDEGPTGVFGQPLGVFGDPARLFLDELAEILDPQPLLGKEALHRVAQPEREVAFEQNSVETGDHSGDQFVILMGKAFHGVLLAMAA